MASRIVTQGLKRIGAQSSQSTPTYSVSRHIQTMAVDDSTATIVAGDTAANSGGAVTNFFPKAFDATPTEASNVITHIMTLTTAQALFTIKRITLHDQPASLPVISSTASLVGGVDAQSLLHTGDFSLQITLKITYTNV